MKLISALAGLASLAQCASAHYIFSQLTTPSGTTSDAIRQPKSGSPIQDVYSNYMICNQDPEPAMETVDIEAGSSFTFHLQEGTVHHQGPAAVYMGQVPAGETAASWYGQGANWFKIAEWGATFNPVSFTDFNVSELTAKIPSSVQAGQYLLRIEQIGLHVPSAAQYYISCAQINVTGGGSANPAKVSIPGYVAPSDPSLQVNIYDPAVESYKVPGPAVFSG